MRTFLPAALVIPLLFGSADSGETRIADAAHPLRDHSGASSFEVRRIASYLTGAAAHPDPMPGEMLREASDWNLAQLQEIEQTAQAHKSEVSSATDQELPVVAIIGTGNVASALGPKLAERGYHVIYGSRDPARAAVRELVERTGPNGSGATQAQAAAQADAVVLAVPAEALEQVVRNLGDLAAKTVVDVTSPAARPGPDGYLEMVPGPTNSERIQAWVPRARVVRAGIPSAYVLAEPQALGVAPTVPIASDDRAAKEAVARMFFAIGLDPFDAGPLRFSRRIDEISLLFFVPLQQERAQGVELKFLRSSYWPCFWDVAAQFGPVSDREDLAQFPQRGTPRPCEEWQER